MLQLKEMRKLFFNHHAKKKKKQENIFAQTAWPTAGVHCSSDPIFVLYTTKLMYM